jgi:hypothetical protein
MTAPLTLEQVNEIMAQQVVGLGEYDTISLLVHQIEWLRERMAKDVRDCLVFEASQFDESQCVCSSDAIALCKWLRGEEVRDPD